MAVNDETAPAAALAERLATRLAERGLTMATAESCTGGLIAALMTSLPGSSATFQCGFVTYANGAKVSMLGVPAALLERHGAVSRECALAMADGALGHSTADVAVAVTGIAGPSGGNAEKPVGLVHVAVAARNGQAAHRAFRFGDLGRDGVRQATVRAALSELLALVDG